MVWLSGVMLGWDFGSREILNTDPIRIRIHNTGTMPRTLNCTLLTVCCYLCSRRCPRCRYHPHNLRRGQYSGSQPAPQHLYRQMNLIYLSDLVPILYIGIFTARREGVGYTLNPPPPHIMGVRGTK